jgi:hypothetical protein
VQPFLPYADFERSARSLDPCRLGKQRAECIQVVRGLTVPGYGWRHHPAVTMWRHRLEALGRYSLTCCEVWTETGRADTCAATLGEDLSTAGVARVRTQAELSRATGWATLTFIAPTSRRCCARTPSTTGRSFQDVPDGPALRLARGPYVWPEA